MSQKLLISSLLKKYMKWVLYFIIGYFIWSVGFITLSHFSVIEGKMSGVSYYFSLVMFAVTWVTVQRGLTYFSYHSYSRKQIMSMLLVVQVILSVIGGLLLIGHQLLVKHTIISRWFDYEDTITNVYVKPLIQHDILEMLVTFILLSVLLFFVLQIANTLALVTYGISVNKCVLSIGITTLVVLGLVFSLKYWPASLVSYSIGTISFILGNNAWGLPNIVIPYTLMALLSVMMIVLNYKKIVTKEINLL